MEDVLQAKHTQETEEVIYGGQVKRDEVELAPGTLDLYSGSKGKIAIRVDATA